MDQLGAPLNYVNDVYGGSYAQEIHRETKAKAAPRSKTDGATESSYNSVLQERGAMIPPGPPQGIPQTQAGAQPQAGPQPQTQTQVPRSQPTPYYPIVSSTSGVQATSTSTRERHYHYHQRGLSVVTLVLAVLLSLSVHSLAERILGNQILSPDWTPDRDNMFRGLYALLVGLALWGYIRWSPKP
jgi:hypothetical protein